MTLPKWLVRRKARKVISVSADTPPGTPIPVDDLDTDIIQEKSPDPLLVPKEAIFPCPPLLILSCICNGCEHMDHCPMERECRMNECSGYIRACMNYTNPRDKDAEDKKIIFKEGGTWEGHCFTFRGKKKNGNNSV